MDADNKETNGKGILKNLERWAAIIALLGLSFTWDQLLSLPTLVYRIVFMVVGIWFFIRFILFVRGTIVAHRKSKQETDEIMVFSMDLDSNAYITGWETHGGFQWKIRAHKRERIIDEIYGPYCLDDRTKMICRETFLGKYEYECPNCLLKVKRDYNSYTLAERFKRIAEAEINS